MKNKYLRLKIAVKRNQKARELLKKENGDKAIKLLTDELSRVIIESR